MNDAVNIRIAGFGGQGVMMAGQILAYAATSEDLNGLWSPSYGPETRGGTANCAVIVSKKPINSPVFLKSHHLLAFNYPSLIKFMDRVKQGGFILYNNSLVSETVLVEGVEVIGVPINDIALELGNIQVINMVMLGAYLEKSKIFEDATIHKVLAYVLGERKAHMVELNVKAIEAGRDFIRKQGLLHA
jgi:2-oxoglutarate ferredoxin oxidoreductase subunit gamma